MMNDSKPAETPSTQSATPRETLSDASATCPSRSVSTTPPAGSTSELTESSGGEKKISDEAAAAALKKIGACTSPEAVAAYRTVGQWSAQQGVAEVALATTTQNDDAVCQALVSAQQILAENPNDVVKTKAISSISTLVKTRINNAELALKCSESIGASKQGQKQLNRAPQFNVQVNVQKDEQKAIPA